MNIANSNRRLIRFRLCLCLAICLSGSAKAQGKETETPGKEVQAQNNEQVPAQNQNSKDKTSPDQQDLKDDEQQIINKPKSPKKPTKRGVVMKTPTHGSVLLYSPLSKRRRPMVHFYDHSKAPARKNPFLVGKEVKVSLSIEAKKIDRKVHPEGKKVDNPIVIEEVKPL